MNIGIFHLTDIHFEPIRNKVLSRLDNIKSAIENEFDDVSKIYIVVSGDIVNQGNPEGHKEAINFLRHIETIIKAIVIDSEPSFIIVPGNHDCNFNDDNQNRRNAISNLSYESLGDDDSVVNTCLVVQDSFWQFYGEFNSIPKNKMFFQTVDIVDGKKICFNCINTAWMSQIDEKQNLFYPVRNIESSSEIESGALNISVFHHPIGWFSPHGSPNGRKEFQGFIEDNSDIAIYGHEHEEDHKKLKDLIRDKGTLYFSGKVLQNKRNHQESGFQLFLVDIENQKGMIKTFQWKKDIFSKTIGIEFNLDGDKFGHKRFKHQPQFLTKINKVTLPIAIERTEHFSLSDFYVFPDLDPNETKDTSFGSFYDAERLTTETKFNLSITRGDNQAGKTSLACMLYHKFTYLDKYPILVDCKTFKGSSAEKIVGNCFKEQYEANEGDFERFTQFDKSNKIAIVDNLHSLLLDATSALELIAYLEARFGKVIILTHTLYALQSKLESIYKGVKVFTIRPLGYRKRNQLIENYHRLSTSTSLDDTLLLHRTKESFNKVENILGNELMPSYPVLVLSIVQTVNNTPTVTDQSAYGHCYHSLIHLALIKKADVSHENTDTYFTILAEFCYDMFKRKETSFTAKELETFFTDHKETYHVGFSFDILLANLEKSQLIYLEDEEYQFAYIYIYYFLAAKKIADIITNPEGKEIVSFLCRNLIDDHNSNILLFVAHHSRDEYLIEEATFSTMVPFEGVPPITLNVKGEYYSMVKDVVKELSEDIMEATSEPLKARDEMMQRTDEGILSQTNTDKSLTEEEFHEGTKPFIQATKAIEIVGQIIKNRKGSIPSKQLVVMIEELYLTSFRTISSYGKHLLDSKTEFIGIVANKINNTDSLFKVEEKVNLEFQKISFRICLNIFGKIIHAVGLKELKELYNKAAEEIGTPAAELVTFSINSYYGTLSVGDLKKIADKHEKNPVVMKIIKSRVQSYLYQNNVDYKKRQKFASILNMQLKELPM